jgi:hypothetical protein
MANLETLTRRGLKAYERGRLRMAARIALVVVPLVAICLLEPLGREACLCSGVLLLGGAVWLRFRNRSGVETVTTGLLAGGIPLAGALLLSRFGPGCASADLVSSCTLFSILIGGLGGAVVAFREAALGARSSHGAMAAIIAALVASLGCARLGIASIAGVVLGIVVGCAATSVARRLA